jgi:ABC-type cobalt transport system substrate-binding protein
MRIRTILAVLLALFAILTLLDRFVLLELLIRRVGLPLLVAIAEALAIVATGAVVRRTKRIDPVLDYLIGYPLFGTLLFLVATIRVSMLTVIPVLVIGVVACLFLLLKRYGDSGGAAASAGEPLRRPTPEAGAAPQAGWATFAVLIVLGCGFIAAQAPPSSLDELAHHLTVPHTWVLEARAIELPLLSHSYLPLGIESADLLPLLLLDENGGGIASHLLHLFAATATTLLIVRRTRSWLTTAAIATTPALAIAAGWSIVEWPLVGVFVALYIALEDDDRDTASAATAAGLLVKYSFLPFALLAWALKRRVPHWTAALGLIFFARNVLLTGNPFAPFFTADAPSVAGFRALALADYIFEGTFVHEALGASLLIAPVFAAGAVPIAAAFLGVALFFLAPSSRILVPFLVVPAVSAAPLMKRRIISVLLAIAIIVQTFVVVWFTVRGDAFALLGGATEQDYLRKQRPSYAAIEWLNTILPPSSRTLVLGISETYWFTRPTRAGGTLDGPRISQYLDLPAPEAVRERLRRDGITHVAVIAAPPAASDAHTRQERQTLSPAAQRMLVQMLDRYSVNMTSHGNATLFTLR